MIFYETILQDKKNVDFKMQIFLTDNYNERSVAFCSDRVLEENPNYFLKFLQRDSK